jgi:hypothetical protein
MLGKRKNRGRNSGIVRNVEHVLPAIFIGEEIPICALLREWFQVLGELVEHIRDRLDPSDTWPMLAPM